MGLLIDQERSVLDALLSLSPEYQPFDNFSFYNHPVCMEMNYDAIAEICRSLDDKKYIRDLKIDDTETIHSLVITQMGRNYKEYQRLEKRERWRERAWGFVSGAIIASIPWLLTNLVG